MDENALERAMIAFQRATDQLEGVIMGKPHGDAVPEASNNSAFVELIADGNTDLANKVRQFQFRDIRPKAASEIDDITHAGRLLGHSKEEMTKRVYRRVGEVVSPTK